MSQKDKMKTLTKADIYADLYRKIGYSKKEATHLVNSVFDIIRDTLRSGSHVKLSGFGNFILKDKKARLGRDPKTGEKITIKARRVVIFHASPLLKKRVSK